MNDFTHEPMSQENGILEMVVSAHDASLKDRLKSMSNENEILEMVVSAYDASLKVV